MICRSDHIQWFVSPSLTQRYCKHHYLVVYQLPLLWSYIHFATTCWFSLSCSHIKWVKTRVVPLGTQKTEERVADLQCRILAEYKSLAGRAGKRVGSKVATCFGPPPMTDPFFKRVVNLHTAPDRSRVGLTSLTHIKCGLGWVGPTCVTCMYS